MKAKRKVIFSYIKDLITKENVPIQRIIQLPLELTQSNANSIKPDTQTNKQEVKYAKTFYKKPKYNKTPDVTQYLLIKSVRTPKTRPELPFKRYETCNKERQIKELDNRLADSNIKIVGSSLHGKWNFVSLSKTKALFPFLHNKDINLLENPKCIIGKSTAGKTSTQINKEHLKNQDLILKFVKNNRDRLNATLTKGVTIKTRRKAKSKSLFNKKALSINN